MAAKRKSSRAQRVKTKRGPARKTRHQGPSVVEEVSRAVMRLRQGEAIDIADKSGKRIAVLSVETATDASLKALATAGRKPLSLLLTHERAQTLKIRLYTPRVVALAVGMKDTAEQLRAIADPTADLDAPLKGPFETERRPLPASFAASVKLAKIAELLPSTIAQPEPKTKAGFSIDAETIFAYDAEVVRTLTLVTRARVPLEGAEKTELVAFRARDGGPEHYAIVINAPSMHDAVLTRLHSECFTGDLLHSLKCDCGDQLRGAIELISKSGGGILLYLAQEGRGIGLINKLRAYRLQDQGFDTIQANERLGFGSDERLYGFAARMLSLLGYKKVRLLTNNPQKVEQLKAEGVDIVERVPHAFPDNEHNRAYLETKAKKAGHLF
jgi:GTP cyclohydrolase II